MSKTQLEFELQKRFNMECGQLRSLASQIKSQKPHLDEDIIFEDLMATFAKVIRGTFHKLVGMEKAQTFLDIFN